MVHHSSTQVVCRGFRQSADFGKGIGSLCTANQRARILQKLAAENYEHVYTFQKVLQDVEKSNLSIFDDGNRLWNVDETVVDAGYDEHVKKLSSSDSNHGGFRAETASSGKGKHVTALIYATAYGIFLPPFFVVIGKCVMTSWTDAVMRNPLLPIDNELYSARLIYIYICWVVAERGRYCCLRERINEDGCSSYVYSTLQRERAQVCK